MCFSASAGLGLWLLVGPHGSYSCGGRDFWISTLVVRIPVGESIKFNNPSKVVSVNSRLQMETPRWCSVSNHHLRCLQENDRHAVCPELAAWSTQARKRFFLPPENWQYWRLESRITLNCHVRTLNCLFVCNLIFNRYCWSCKVCPLSITICCDWTP